MFLSELQYLSTESKLKYLSSPEGIGTLKEWLSTGYSLHRIATILDIPKTALYKICDYNADITAVTGRPLLVAGVKPIKVDHSRPIAYRIVTGYSYSHKRGDILGEYITANELWQSDFIRNYFNSFGRYESGYLDNYLTSVYRNGIYYLSNRYTIAYCEVNKRGILKIHIPDRTK